MSSDATYTVPQIVSECMDHRALSFTLRLIENSILREVPRSAAKVSESPGTTLPKIGHYLQLYAACRYMYHPRGHPEP